MIEAVQRLFLITLITLFLTFLGVFFMRWVGSQQAYSAPVHPWFTMDAWTVVENRPSEPCNIKPSPENALLWTQVKFSDGNWRVVCAEPKTVKSILAESPHANWLLDVVAVETAHLDALVADLEPFEKTKSFGIHSRSQTVARYLRKKAPQWVFAADAATLLRLHMFASLWLETAFDFWPDFVVQNPSEPGTRLSAREIQELERRHKRIIEMR